MKFENINISMKTLKKNPYKPINIYKCKLDYITFPTKKEPS